MWSVFDKRAVHPVYEHRRVKHLTLRGLLPSTFFVATRQVLSHFEQLPITDKIFLMDVKQSTVLTPHNSCAPFEIKLD